MPRYTTYNGDGNGTDTFGDGSNRWIPGLVETVRNPVDRLRNPYDTVAGAADAATINFDEGVGGLLTTVDDEPGNTAGPGQSPAFTWLPGVERQPGQPENPGTTGSPVLDRMVQVAVLGIVVYAVINVVIPVLQIVANLSGDGE